MSRGVGRDPGVTDHDQTTDPYVFETQLIASYQFNKTTKLTIAPAWMVYTAGTFKQSSAASIFGDVNENPFQDSALVSGATRHLNIIQVPGDLSFKAFGLPAKLYWDFAYNLEGKARSEDIYRNYYQIHRVRDPNDSKSAHRGVDDVAWLAGFQIGENKKKGDLSFTANYRRTGLSSIDPNINDSDFGLSELNIQGYKLSLAYNVMPFAEIRVTWEQAWNVGKQITLGESTTGNAIADANEADVLLIDLTAKF